MQVNTKRRFIISNVIIINIIIRKRVITVSNWTTRGGQR